MVKQSVFLVLLRIKCTLKVRLWVSTAVAGQQEVIQGRWEWVFLAARGGLKKRDRQVKILNSQVTDLKPGTLSDASSRTF